jgi:hypothetical protein
MDNPLKENWMTTISLKSMKTAHEKYKFIISLRSPDGI